VVSIFNCQFSICDLQLVIEVPDNGIPESLLRYENGESIVVRRQAEIRRNILENHRKSRIKRVRRSGFRARMRTRSGRKILSNKRKKGLASGKLVVSR